MSRSPAQLPQGLVRSGFLTVGIKLANTALSFITVTILARLLGPKGYGTYAYVIALVSMLSVPVQFGLPTLVVRETAKAQALKAWGLLRGVVLISSTAIALASAIGAWLFAQRFTYEQLATFGWGLLLLPLLALGAIRGAILRGLRHVIAGQFPEFLVRPVLFLILVLLAMYGWPQATASPASVMAINAFAAATAFLFGLWALHRHWPEPASTAAPATLHHDWLRSLWPLGLGAGMHFINSHTDIIMLGFFESSAEVGTYRVAVAGAALVSLVLAAGNMVISPHFSQLYAERRNDELQKLATRSARLMFTASLPIGLAFIVFGNELLTFAFGADYVPAYASLVILSVGQLFNVFAGSVGMLLNMTGHERDATRGVAVAAVANVPLNLALIPAFGMEGAAIATAISLLIWNVILWRAAHARLRIRSSAIGH
jgi:O-antigen/teichoic acid export membrane protein